MDGMQHGAGGSIEDHAVWSAASRLARAAHTVSVQPLRRARSTDDTRHQDAITVRQPPGALQPFAVTPTLYFHADTSAAVALTVGVESVAIDPQRAVTDVQAVS
ncbi:hypothetical protein ACSFA2_13775 [Variovorax sp. LT2P21]|uniref:hypothetical protein n=1 Tax=Variovorax sp. LT2P21 TaxID=3443731 RepID=UPI003F482C56